MSLVSPLRPTLGDAQRPDLKLALLGTPKGRFEQNPVIHWDLDHAHGHA